MGLKCTNPNGEIVLVRKLNHVELCFLKICKNCIQKWILQVIFLRRCLDCLKNKIVHNLHITYSNKMNQSFPCRQNIIYEKKNLKKKFEILNFFFAAHSPLFWAYLDITFVARHQLGKKLCSHEAIQFSYLQKKFQKIMI